MVEAVSAAKQNPLADIDRATLVNLAEYAIPMVMGLVLLFSTQLVIQRVGLLLSWNDDHAGAGTFLVESCQEQLQFGADQWSCAGRVTAEGGSTEQRTTMLTSLGAYASERPYVGQRIDIFHPTGNDSLVYPLRFRLNELARLYLSLLPRLAVLIGSALWLAGWALTRHVDPEDFVARDSMRFPQRFSWQSKGVTWIGVALASLVLNHLVTSRVIGSLELI